MDEHQMKDEAISHYEAALKEAFPTGATGDVFHHWNEARKALEQEKALQALHNENERLGLYKDAYGQPEPEPVAWAGVDFDIKTSPPKREWHGLTDDERSYYLQTASNIGWWKASEIIEAKLKAKNGFPQTEKNT